MLIYRQICDLVFLEDIGELMRLSFATMLGLLGLTAAIAQADTTVLTFEGLKNLEPVLNYYNGGAGGSGSGPGPNDGIVFSANSLAIIQGNAGGSGDFGGEPSPVTALFFLSGGADTMNVASGFTTGFSFFYSAAFDPGVVTVWSGLNGTGTILASLALPLTPNNGNGCTGFGAGSNPGANYCPFEPFGVTFSGTAMSVDFGGTANKIAFDNITLGSSTPDSGTPEPASVLFVGLGGTVLFAGVRWTRKRALAAPSNIS